MNGFLRLILVTCLALGVARCASNPPTENDSESASVEGASDQDFSEFDQPSDSNSNANSESSNSGNSDQALEDELNQAEGKQAESAPPANTDNAQEAPAGGDEFAQFEDQPKAEEQPVAEQPMAEQPPASEQAPIAEQLPMVDSAPMAEQAPIVETAPPIDPPAPEVAQPISPEASAPVAAEVPQQKLVKIKNIKYKANDSGGTVVIEANGPMTFQTRTNAETGQFIIEIPGVSLPKKLKRPFNTKDIKGGIGSIDAYQNKGSTTARIVVQLRQGATEPVVQAEGNSLLVVESSQAPAPVAAEVPAEAPKEESKILSSQSLEEFLIGNAEFYGKKISVETSEMDVREVFKLISEESGINLVLSDEVKGTVSVKLRQVPWDQALVVIMRAKKLGYTRAGNVLRIAPLADIRAEEDDTIKLANSRKAQAPLRVRVVPVSYAKIDDLVGQVRPFLSERGKVVGDNRTSSIVISDLDENIDRVLKLITSVDVPPPQVLIEGKVVEASDRFQRQVGVNWSASGRPSVTGSNGTRDVKTTSSLSIAPGVGASVLGINFQMGTLDVLGDLSATLGLAESQNLVKVLSSPRIMTLHNEQAEINQTTEIPLLQENTTSTGTTRTVTFKPVKLKLSVTPQITNDAAVIMAVDVNRDFLGSIEEPKTGARSVNSRSAKTKVMVKNGQTAVIGGIYQSDSTQGETKVPWIGDIPLLGWLFKSKSWDNNKNELLIFLTPRIVGQADAQAIPAEIPSETPAATGGDL